MTESPKPLSDGYNVDSADESVHNWLVTFGSGETFTAESTQWGICELALERFKKKAENSYELNFGSATLDWVEWSDDVIRGRIDFQYWKDKPSEDSQTLEGKVIHFTAATQPAK
jgi:hypothetical protein